VSLDAADPSQKAITHVANSEIRIRFEEVELQPKTSDQSDSINVANQQRAPTLPRMAEMQSVDVLTGSIVDEEHAGKVSRRRSRKGKGKEVVQPSLPEAE